jgi:fructoselysine-6-P-deglycase FrlB-like protein
MVCYADMGRPYESEVTRFPETYEWALTVDVQGIAAAIRRSARHPLRAIGSGGSLSAAHFCADWHQRVTGRLAHASTPLEVVGAGGTRGAAVSVFSASGRNRDILRAFASAMAGDPPSAWIVTATPKSRLEIAASEVSSANGATFNQRPPAGRDGFLATNSLLTFCVVTHRAYQVAFGLASDLPDRWSTFAGEGGPAIDGATAEQLFGAAALVVLHGYTTRAAAVDLESKCIEAGLVSVHVADLRNFAHGRHHWLAKKPDSAVLAIVAPEDEALAKRTMALLPRSVTKSVLWVQHPGMLGGLRGIVDAMRLVRVAGRVRGIDPGRPGVPSYGNKIYSLRGIDMVRAADEDRKGVSAVAMCAIQRKTQRPFDSLNTAERNYWLDAFTAVRNAFRARAFPNIVFDYDGTLVDVEDRFTGPRSAVTRFLIWLLEAGVRMGIATGRGRSVGNDLRARLPERFWASVLVGYYNGGEIAPLADADAPDRSDGVDPSLALALAALKEGRVVPRLATVTARRPQITIQPHDVSRTVEAWDATLGALARAGVVSRVVRSTHSIDVLGHGVSKVALVRAMRAHSTAAGPVLRIGDLAVSPGNDAEMLSCTEGISVNEVSSDPESAWNFAPPGLSGVPATLALKTLMRVSRSGSVRVKIDE